MSLDDWLNTFEDEDGDGVPDWMEAAGITGVGVGMVLLGVASLVFAAKSYAVGMAVALGLVIAAVGVTLSAAYGVGWLRSKVNRNA